MVYFAYGEVPSSFTMCTVLYLKFFFERIIYKPPFFNKYCYVRKKHFVGSNQQNDKNIKITLYLLTSAVCFIYVLRHSLRYSEPYIRRRMLVQAFETGLTFCCAPLP